MRAGPAHSLRVTEEWFGDYSQVITRTYGKFRDGDFVGATRTTSSKRR